MGLSAETWMAIAAWAGLAGSAVGAVISLRSGRKAKDDADAARKSWESIAASMKELSSKPEVDFRVERSGKHGFVLRNRGATVTGVEAKADLDSRREPVVTRDLPDGTVCLAPGEGHKFVSADRTATLIVTCDQSDEPLYVPMPQ